MQRNPGIARDSGQSRISTNPFYVGFPIAGYELGLQPENEIQASKSDSVLAYWGVENV